MGEDWVAGLAAEAMSLLRASDTFKLLTIDAATGLSESASRRKGRINLIRLETQQVRNGQAKVELEQILGRAESQVAVQEKVAGWLRGLANDGDESGGDG